MQESDKKHSSKNLAVSAKDDKCWLCNKFFVAEDNKIKNHCHITGKYGGSVHWSCNINLTFSKKIPVIFHNLKGYDSPLLIMTVT